MTVFRALVLAVVVIVASLIVVARNRRNASQETRTPASLETRLRKLLSDRRDYKVFIGMPPSSPQRWAKADGVSEAGLIVEGVKVVSFADVTAAVVAYPNGQALLQECGPLHYPQGITGLTTAAVANSDIIQLADISEGEKYVRVTYGPSQMEPNRQDHYSTALTNISGKKIRVARFGGYYRTSKGYELRNATGAFYSAEEFRNWYGQSDSEWLLPGQTVKDLNNYGSRPTIWAYHCVTEDGKSILVGAELK
jgi:hypothetical protein